MSPVDGGAQQYTAFILVDLLITFELRYSWFHLLFLEREWLRTLLGEQSSSILLVILILLDDLVGRLGGQRMQPGWRLVEARGFLDSLGD